MNEICTTGTWRPNVGKEDAFVAAWTSFATWANGMPGAGVLRLTRDLEDSGRYVSFGIWDSAEAVRNWKTSPEFRERIAQVLQHVGEFDPTELAVIATASNVVMAKA